MHFSKTLLAAIAAALPEWSLFFVGELLIRPRVAASAPHLARAGGVEPGPGDGLHAVARRLRAARRRPAPTQPLPLAFPLRLPAPQTTSRCARRVG